MANIRVDVGYTIKDGTELTFRSPVDCSQITGLIVYYLGEDGNTTSKVFVLADAHGNNVGDIDHLFAEDVVVKVILDVTKGMAFVQNADTNAYLEAELAKKYSPTNKPSASDVGARPSTWTPTAAEVGAAPASHGNHVPATETANNAKFLRNDNTWQTVTPANIGARPSTWMPSASDVGARPNTWMPTASDVGAVPTSRTINGKALSGDITLSASDVGAASDGYGLGKSAPPTMADANVNTPAQFFRTTSSVINLGSLKTHNVGIVMPYAADEVAQLWVRTLDGTVRVRRCSYDKWYEEFVNPPMELGVEYRTTERYKGNPVYTKIVSVGNLPAANAKVSVAYSTETVTPIRVCGADTGKSTIPKSYVSSAGAWQECFVYAMGSSVYISSKYDHSSLSADVQVWYIKG